MEDGDGGHRNEAISAVADVGFLGEEEEEDDYEDLYNDVNVGEGFLQSLRASEEEHEEKVAHVKQEPPDVEPLNRVPIPGVAAVNVKIEKDSVLEGAFLDSRVIKTEMVPKGPITVPGAGIKVELGERSGKSLAEIGGQIGNSSLQPQPHVAGNSNFLRHGVGAAGGSSNSISNVNGGNCNGGGAGNIGGGTLLFVGELHWWTTDAELESELSKYGQVKEVKFFDEKASGKSKGYCQVEFYDPAAASACKEGMNGHLFNGRPCVVAFASPYSIRRMGEAQVNKSQAMGQGAPQQGRRGGPGDIGGGGGYARGNAPATGTNYQGGEGGRNFGRGGGWGRGGAMGNRGQMGQMRNRMGFGGRGIIGSGATGFGQGLASATPPLMHPQAMMGQGFDPSYAAAMGRMGGYGGFPTGPSPLPGMMPSFPPVGGVGLPGVAPHVNPAFFGRGMPTNGIGMMPGTGMEGTSVGMWSDPSMGGWGSEDQGGRAAESSYGEDATSDQRYGDGSHERGGWSNVDKEKDRPPERGFSGTSPTRGYREDRKPGWDRREKDLSPEQDRSGRRHRDEREMGWEPEREHKRDSERERERERERGRSRDHERDHYREERDLYRDERDRHPDHRRYKDRELDHDDEWDRGHSSRTHSKSRMSREEEQRHRSREMDHGKRRRLPSE